MRALNADAMRMQCGCSADVPEFTLEEELLPAAVVHLRIIGFLQRRIHLFPDAADGEAEHGLVLSQPLDRFKQQTTTNNTQMSNNHQQQWLIPPSSPVETIICLETTVRGEMRRGEGATLAPSSQRGRNRSVAAKPRRYSV